MAQTKKEVVFTKTGKVNGSAIYRNITGTKKGDKFDYNLYNMVKKTVSELGLDLLGQR